MKKALIPSLLMMTVLLFGMILAFLLYQFFPPKQSKPAATEIRTEVVTKEVPVTAPKSSETKPSEPEKRTLKDIIKSSQNKVVQIETEEGTGSGFLYNNKGDIVTNAHVVGYHLEVTIKTSTEHEYIGKVIGRSESTDIALIRVIELASVKPLKMKDYTAELGDEVVALGSPLGMQNTVTTGIISGLERSFSTSHFHYENMYQITAPISPGNSGGPIVSGADGSVLGINSVKHTEEDIGFSIPIYAVLSLLHEWSANPMILEDYNDSFVYELPEYDGDIVEDDSGDYGTDEGADITEEYPEENSEDDYEDEEPYYGDTPIDEPLSAVHEYVQAINNRDFEAAYHLIGGNWKSSLTSIADFAKGYENTISIRIVEQSIVDNNDGTFTATLQTEADEYVEGEYRTSAYHFSYNIGLEDGIYKLLGGEMY